MKQQASWKNGQEMRDELQRLKSSLAQLLQEEKVDEGTDLSAEHLLGRAASLEGQQAKGSGDEPMVVPGNCPWPDPSISIEMPVRSLVRILDALVGEVSYARAGYIRFALMEHFLKLLDILPTHPERQQFATRRLLDAVLKQRPLHRRFLSVEDYNQLREELGGLHGVDPNVFEPFLASAFLGRPHALNPEEMALFHSGYLTQTHTLSPYVAQPPDDHVNGEPAGASLQTHSESPQPPTGPRLTLPSYVQGSQEPAREGAPYKRVSVSPEETRAAMVHALHNLPESYVTRILKAFGVSPGQKLPCPIVFDKEGLRRFRQQVDALAPIIQLPQVEKVSVEVTP